MAEIRVYAGNPRRRREFFIILCPKSSLLSSRREIFRERLHIHIKLVFQGGPRPGLPTRGGVHASNPHSRGVA